MRTIAAVALTTLTMTSACLAATPNPWAAPVTEVPRTYGWGFGIDLNEIRLRVTGGYKGERIDRSQLRVAKRFRVATIYARRDDPHPSAKSRLYVDRDGDGVIDAGALYNPRTGVVSVDWGCDGVGDQIVADLTPPRRSLRWMLEHPDAA